MRHLWLVAFVIGCGGGEGGLDLDPDERLVTLSTDEYTELCEYLIAALPRRTVTCPEGDVTVGVDTTLEECVDEFSATQSEIPNCPVTVGEYRACIDAQARRSDDLICDPVEGDNPPPECFPLFTTACGFD